MKCSVCEEEIRECLCICTGICESDPNRCNVHSMTMGLVDGFRSLADLNRYRRERIIAQVMREGL